jgi:hypothetical protein
MMQKTRANKSVITPPASNTILPAILQRKLKTWTRPQGVQISHITREEWNDMVEHDEGDIDGKPVSTKPAPSNYKDLIGREVWYSWRLNSNRDYYYYWSKTKVLKINSAGKAKVSDGTSETFIMSAYDGNWFLA